MNAGILSIGDELALGDRVDTNSAWIARRLSERGVRVVRLCAAPDDRREIAAAIECIAGASAELLIATGGLGPTADDLTRFALTDVLREPLITDDEVVAALEQRYRRARVEMPRANLIQAQRPASSAFIANPLGTAPGIDATLRRGADADTPNALARESAALRMFFLPGVPGEMKRMFDDYVAPALTAMLRGVESNSIAAATVQVVSIAESRVAELLADLMRRGEDPVVGTLVSDGVISVRVRSSSRAGNSAEPAESMTAHERVNSAAQEIARRLDPYVYGRDDEPLALAAQRRLVQQHLTLATAESCTGGLLGAMITHPAGASACYLGGWQTYTDEMKMTTIGVPEATVRDFGAVSAETARAMAAGAIDRSGADVALSITGVAGPGGGSIEKPVGLVYIGLAARDSVMATAPAPGRQRKTIALARRFEFAGEREMVRQRSATTALAMLIFFLDHHGDIPPLLWESAAPPDS